MKKPKIKLYFMTALLIRLYSCNSSDEVLDKSPDTASAFKIINVTTNDGHPFALEIQILQLLENM
jgi:alpha-amylase